MGKKSRAKKERNKQRQEDPGTQHRQQIRNQIFKRAADPLDPELIEAYTRGREVGREQGFQEGRAEGITEAILLHADWIEQIDEIPEIGEKRKLAIFQYFNDKAREYIARTKEEKDE